MLQSNKKQMSKQGLWRNNANENAFFGFLTKFIKSWQFLVEFV